MKGEVHNTVYPLHTVTIFYPIIWQYRLQNQVLASRVVHLHRTRLPCSLKRHGARNSSTHTKFAARGVTARDAQLLHIDAASASSRYTHQYCITVSTLSE